MVYLFRLFKFNKNVLGNNNERKEEGTIKRKNIDG